MDYIARIFRRFSDKSKVLVDDLETLEQYRQRWRSVRIIYFTMFLMSLGFSIVLTGILPYLDKLDPSAGKIFMGFVVAANPLGQMLFSPLVGWWGNRMGSIRIPLLCSITIFTIASAMYASLELFTSYAKWWMFGARFLVGVSSANIAVCRSYLSAATRIEERTGAVSMVSLAQILGFIIGPGLQTAVTPLGGDGKTFFGGALILNMYTATGWINVLMGLCNFYMFLPVIFHEHRIAAKEVMVAKGMENERETWKSIKPDYLSAWTLIGAFFVLVFNFVLLETLGTSLAMDQFAWNKMDSLYYMGILMSFGAVIACITFAGIGPLCKKFEERHVLLWGGFFLMVIGRALYIPWGDGPPLIYDDSNITLSYNSTEHIGCPSSQTWCETTRAMTLNQFIIGYALTSVGYPIGVTLIQTIFSKILGPRPQGVWMGLMTGSGCFSRVLGPVFVGVIYTRYGTNWTFGFTTVMMAVSMFWLWIVKDRLIPPVIEKPPAEMVAINGKSVDFITDDKPKENDSFLTNGKI